MSSILLTHAKMLADEAIVQILLQEIKDLRGLIDTMIMDEAATNIPEFRQEYKKLLGDLNDIEI